MKRYLAFSGRNRKEILRDPLSYIFCLAFPLVMLFVMTLVDSSIPREAGMTVFHIENLSPGIAVFGQTFVMLFTALTVSKDRTGSFLVRLYATPMKASDFVIGYTLPMLVIGMAQACLIYLVSLPLSWLIGTALDPVGLIVSLFALIPGCIMFIGFGFLFGTLFSEKSAPGLCSILISLGSFLGCIWFDADAAGGVMLKICRLLPFYYCTRSARSSVRMDFAFDAWLLPLLIVGIWALAVVCISSLVFRRKMKADAA